MMTRRHFLYAAAGTLAVRTMRGQTLQPVPLPGLEAGEQTRSLALRNVTVIDATGRPPVPGMTVVITGNKITSVGKTAALSEMPVVNASGKFLIHGLWDMHVHDPQGEINPLFIANGVLGIRTMGGSATVAREFLKRREEVATGKRIGPRLVVASQTLYGSVVPNPEAARVAVRDAAQAGADFIKVYSNMSAESYFATVDEAKRLSIPFVGHVPDPPGFEECAKAGQRSFEHMAGVYGYLRRITGVNDGGAGVRPERLSSEQTDALFNVFMKYQVWLCPTMTAIYGLAGYPRLKDDPRLKYFDPVTKAGWALIFKKDGLATVQRRYESLGLIGAMHKAGVGILAGTDTVLSASTGNNAPYCLPGFGLHDELRHLVAAAGLSPMDALRTATYNPAKFLGLLDSLGTVEAGKRAELLLLDANPLADIANTAKINMVFTSGRVYRKPALEAMLNAVETNARNAFTPSQDVLTKYVGSYDFNKQVITVELEDGILWLGWNDNPKEPLRPISETTFTNTFSPSLIEFAKNNRGEVTQVIMGTVQAFRRN